MPRPGVSPALLFELLRLHLAEHGEFVTCALMQRALEHHERVCDGAADLQQDVVNDLVSDEAAALLTQEVARLRLEADRCGIRARGLALSLPLDGLLVEMEKISRLQRERVRLQRAIVRQGAAS